MSEQPRKPLLSYSEYFDRYRGQLLAAGVGEQDASTAIRLGWDIMFTHQACYGADSKTPVNYGILPREPGDHVAASCHGGKYGGTRDGYTVYPTDLYRLIQEQFQMYRFAFPTTVILAAIAVHEVRHRVQDRESATLVTFDRSRLVGVWTDGGAGTVALNMHVQFSEDEATMRMAGAPESEIRWQLSASEFDAAVVERLYMHRHATVQSMEQLAAFVRMNAPYLAPR